ncbi:MAG: hypothetical protein WBM86_00505, partial [Waterburya sp.]
MSAGTLTTHCRLTTGANTRLKPLSGKTSVISDRLFCEKCGSTRSLIRTVRSTILNLVLAHRKRGRKPTLQVMLDLTTLEKVG